MTKGILSEILTGGAPDASAPAQTTANAVETLSKMVKTFNVDMIGIEIECVVGGALQRIKFGCESDPTQILPWLKALDPSVKVRDDFPKGGFGGKFGGKDTLHARVLMIQVRKSTSGTFIDLVSRNGDDFTVAVTKKNVEGFGVSVHALGKLTERSLAKLDASLSGKDNTGMVVLTGAEQFGVKYWKSDDGKCFMDSVCVEVPEQAAEGTE